MDASEWAAIAVAVGSVVIIVWGFASGAMKKPSKEQVRRGGGNALLAIEEFVQPRIEHVVTARQDRNEDDSEAGAGDGPPPVLRFAEEPRNVADRQERP